MTMASKGVVSVLSTAAALVLIGCGDSDCPSSPTPAPAPDPPASLGDPRGKPCENFFADSVGQRVNQTAAEGMPEPKLPVTIVDPLPAEVCKALNKAEGCIYVHMKGFDSDCQAPGPPDSKHTYIKVTYTDKCTALMSTDINRTLAIDDDDDFDPQTGVFKQCRDKVISRTAFCYEPVVPGKSPYFPYPDDFEIRRGTGECTLKPVGKNPYADENCDPFFGAGLNTNAKVTIIDQMVPDLFCKLNPDAGGEPCVYVHKIGDKKCITPTPPDKGHKYQIVEYTDDCQFPADIASGDILKKGDGKFNEDGVLISCLNHVKFQRDVCWEPVTYPLKDQFPFDVPNYRVQTYKCERDLEEGNQLVV